MNRLRKLKKELKELEKDKPTLKKYNITKKEVNLSKKKSEEVTKKRQHFQTRFTVILSFITFSVLIYLHYQFVLSSEYETFSLGGIVTMILWWAFIVGFGFSQIYNWLGGKIAWGLHPFWYDETTSHYDKYLEAMDEYHSSIQKKETEINHYEDEIKQIEKQKKRNYWIKQNGYEFERSIAHLFEGLGYNVKQTRKTGDEGVDMFLNNNIIVQCKATKSPIAPSVLRDLYGTMQHFKAQKGIIVSTGGFTSGSIDFAMGKNIDLWNMDKILSVSKSIELRE